MTKTKRVRIAVAVQLNGEVCACAMKDGQTAEQALAANFYETMLGARLTIAEVDAPMPEKVATVRGEVVDG